MDTLKDKLLKIKEILSKGMKNGGIGGKGSVKSGASLPSLPKVGTVNNNSATPSTGISQSSKKNPIKSAEQTQNKDIKDIKMKEAQSALKAPPMIKFDDNGQWSVNKSGYKGYNDADNAKRKANNTSETTGIHTMNSVKQYGGSGPNAASKEAAKMKAKSKKNPVKTFSPEEIAAINIERSKKD